MKGKKNSKKSQTKKKNIFNVIFNNINDNSNKGNIYINDINSNILPENNKEESLNIDPKFIIDFISTQISDNNNKCFIMPDDEILKRQIINSNNKCNNSNNNIPLNQRPFNITDNDCLSFTSEKRNPFNINFNKFIYEGNTKRYENIFDFNDSKLASRLDFSLDYKSLNNDSFDILNKKRFIDYDDSSDILEFFKDINSNDNNINVNTKENLSSISQNSEIKMPQRNNQIEMEPILQGISFQKDLFKLVKYASQGRNKKDDPIRLKRPIRTDHIFDYVTEAHLSNLKNEFIEKNIIDENTLSRKLIHYSEERFISLLMLSKEDNFKIFYTDSENILKNIEANKPKYYNETLSNYLKEDSFNLFSRKIDEIKYDFVVHEFKKRKYNKENIDQFKFKAFEAIRRIDAIKNYLEKNENLKKNVKNERQKLFDIICAGFKKNINNK